MQGLIHSIIVSKILILKCQDVMGGGGGVFGEGNLEYVQTMQDLQYPIEHSKILKDAYVTCRKYK